MTQVRFRVDLTPGCSIGPGKIELLEGILETGSLSAAARRLGMSYRRAWLLLDSLNRAFREPLATASVGGRGGGGVRVTAFGRKVVAEYRRFEADVQRLGTRRWQCLAAAARPVTATQARRSITRPSAPDAGARAPHTTPSARRT